MSSLCFRKILFKKILKFHIKMLMIFYSYGELISQYVGGCGVGGKFLYSCRC